MALRRAPLTGVQANELLKGFTTRMIHSLPAEWDQLFVEFRAMGSYTELRAHVLTVLGGTVEWTLPDSELAFLRDLRDAMYKPGEGTWNSVRYHLVHPGEYSVEYNWREEPDWVHPPPAEYFEQELEDRPRDEDELPEWFEQRLDGTAPDTGTMR